MTGVLLLAHGSRAKVTEETFEAIALMTKKQLPGILMQTAYMEFSALNIADGLNELAAAGADEIVIVPYFLFTGMHIQKDIPAEIQRFHETRPDVSIRLGGTLGPDPRLADILADRVREALS
ncbi:MAG: CbiX/SirB N-terminal domain-containing protein [Clostridiales bacterium]|jgi:sirohydrochlorin ferrochelatase|nr:CbiX/SirB N-terminal domain-containing protein [Clostridiales bacterium]